jgi:hypothetical protein
MRTKLYLPVLLLAVLFFSSCKKWRPENRIIGSWKLVEVEKRRLFDKETIRVGYEPGTFVFTENGTASYIDTSVQMTGSWEMRRENTGYYDADGNWQTNGKTVFRVRLYNFSANRVIDWYFDRIDFRNSGNKLFAFIDGASYNYRYDFRKQ